jgi:hypothetical protein
MPTPSPDIVLAAAQRSLAAAAAGDRAGWLALFSPDARVEDPVGSAPHRGHVALGHFFDTFIGPREIGHHPGTDVVAGNTVLRDLTLEIQMASALSLQVPAYIRYDLIDTTQGLKISALSAYWELPAMIRRFVLGGVPAVPAAVQLSRAMLTHQGVRGTLGFLRGFGGTGTGAAAAFARFLDDACGGDELGLRRSVGDIDVTAGDGTVRSASELARLLAGSRWDKLIRSGHAAVARVQRDGRRGVVVGELRARGTERAALSRLQLFGDIG